MLDPKLNRDQLYQIARNSAHLDTDLLDDLRYHENAWLELQQWAQIVAGIGDPTAWPPPPAPPVEEPAPRRRWGLAPTPVPATAQGEEPATTRPGRRRQALIAGGAITLMVVAALVGNHLLSASPQSGVQSGPQSDIQSGAQSGAQSGGDALTAPLRAGYSSFECYTWGVGVSCHGLTSKEDNQPATEVDGLEETPIAALSVGRGFGAAVDTAGTVYAWGANDAGQLGEASTKDENLVVVGELPEAPEMLVSGAAHTCALVSGDIYCFGSNEFGQIRGVATDGGIGLTKITGPREISSLGTSGYNTWASSEDGTWVWGNNKYGQSIPTDEAATIPPTLIERP